MELQNDVVVRTQDGGNVCCSPSPLPSLESTTAQPNAISSESTELHRTTEEHKQQHEPYCVGVGTGSNNTSRSSEQQQIESGGRLDTKPTKEQLQQTQHQHLHDSQQQETQHCHQQTQHHDQHQQISAATNTTLDKNRNDSISLGVAADTAAAVSAGGDVASGVISTAPEAVFIDQSLPPPVPPPPPNDDDIVSRVVHSTSHTAVTFVSATGHCNSQTYDNANIGISASSLLPTSVGVFTQDSTNTCISNAFLLPNTNDTELLLNSSIVSDVQLSTTDETKRQYSNIRPSSADRSNSVIGIKPPTSFCVVTPYESSCRTSLQSNLDLISQHSNTISVRNEHLPKNDNYNSNNDRSTNNITSLRSNIIGLSKINSVSNKYCTDSLHTILYYDNNNSKQKSRKSDDNSVTGQPLNVNVSRSVSGNTRCSPVEILPSSANNRHDATIDKSILAYSSELHYSENHPDCTTEYCTTKSANFCSLGKANRRYICSTQTVQPLNEEALCFSNIVRQENKPFDTLNVNTKNSNPLRPCSVSYTNENCSVFKSGDCKGCNSNSSKTSLSDESDTSEQTASLPFGQSFDVCNCCKLHRSSLSNLNDARDKSFTKANVETGGNVCSKSVVQFDKLPCKSDRLIDNFIINDAAASHYKDNSTTTESFNNISVIERQQLFAETGPVQVETNSVLLKLNDSELVGRNCNSDFVQKSGDDNLQCVCPETVLVPLPPPDHQHSSNSEKLLSRSSQTQDLVPNPLPENLPPLNSENNTDSCHEKPANFEHLSTNSSCQASTLLEKTLAPVDVVQNLHIAHSELQECVENNSIVTSSESCVCNYSSAVSNMNSNINITGTSSASLSRRYCDRTFAALDTLCTRNVVLENEDVLCASVLANLGQCSKMNVGSSVGRELRIDRDIARDGVTNITNSLTVSQQLQSPCISQIKAPPPPKEEISAQTSHSKQQQQLGKQCGVTRTIEANTAALPFSTADIVSDSADVTTATCTGVNAYTIYNSTTAATTTTTTAAAAAVTNKCTDNTVHVRNGSYINDFDYVLSNTLSTISDGIDTNNLNVDNVSPVIDAASDLTTTSNDIGNVSDPVSANSSTANRIESTDSAAYGKMLNNSNQEQYHRQNNAGSSIPTLNEAGTIQYQSSQDSGILLTSVPLDDTTSLSAAALSRRAMMGLTSCGSDGSEWLESLDTDTCSVFDTTNITTSIGGQETSRGGDNNDTATLVAGVASTVVKEIDMSKTTAVALSAAITKEMDEGSDDNGTHVLLARTICSYDAGDAEYNDNKKQTNNENCSHTTMETVDYLETHSFDELTNKEDVISSCESSDEFHEAYNPILLAQCSVQGPILNYLTNKHSTDEVMIQPSSVNLKHFSTSKKSSKIESGDSSQNIVKVVIDKQSDHSHDYSRNLLRDEINDSLDHKDVGSLKVKSNSLVNQSLVLSDQDSFAYITNTEKHTDWYPNKVDNSVMHNTCVISTKNVKLSSSDKHEETFAKTERTRNDNSNKLLLKKLDQFAEELSKELVGEAILLSSMLAWNIHCSGQCRREQCRQEYYQSLLQNSPPNTLNSAADSCVVDKEAVYGGSVNTTTSGGGGSSSDGYGRSSSSSVASTSWLYFDHHHKGSKSSNGVAVNASRHSSMVLNLSSGGSPGICWTPEIPYSSSNSAADHDCFAIDEDFSSNKKTPFGNLSEESRISSVITNCFPYQYQKTISTNTGSTSCNGTLIESSKQERISEINKNCSNASIRRNPPTSQSQQSSVSMLYQNASKFVTTEPLTTRTSFSPSRSSSPPLSPPPSLASRPSLASSVSHDSLICKNNFGKTNRDDSRLTTAAVSHDDLLYNTNASGSRTVAASESCFSKSLKAPDDGDDLLYNTQTMLVQFEKCKRLSNANAEQKVELEKKNTENKPGVSLVCDESLSDASFRVRNIGTDTTLVGSESTVNNQKRKKRKRTKLRKRSSAGRLRISSSSQANNNNFLEKKESKNHKDGKVNKEKSHSHKLKSDSNDLYSVPVDTIKDSGIIYPKAIIASQPRRHSSHRKHRVTSSTITAGLPLLNSNAIAANIDVANSFANNNINDAMFSKPTDFKFISKKNLKENKKSKFGSNKQNRAKASSAELSRASMRQSIVSSSGNANTTSVIESPRCKRTNADDRQCIANDPIDTPLQDVPETFHGSDNTIQSEKLHQSRASRKERHEHSRICRILPFTALKSCKRKDHSSDSRDDVYGGSSDQKGNCPSKSPSLEHKRGHSLFSNIRSGLMSLFSFGSSERSASKEQKPCRKDSPVENKSSINLDSDSQAASNNCDSSISDVPCNSVTNKKHCNVVVELTAAAVAVLNENQETQTSLDLLNHSNYSAFKSAINSDGATGRPHMGMGGGAVDNTHGDAEHIYPLTEPRDNHENNINKEAIDTLNNNNTAAAPIVNELPINPCSINNGSNVTENAANNSLTGLVNQSRALPQVPGGEAVAANADGSAISSIPPPILPYMMSPPLAVLTTRSPILGQSCLPPSLPPVDWGQGSSVFSQRTRCRPEIPDLRESSKGNGCHFASMIEKVKDYGWYWGPISCKAAEKIVSPEPDGSFIVRDSSDEHYIFSLTFKLNGLVRHVRIEHGQGNFSFGRLTKFKSQTIVEFIESAVSHSRSGRYMFFLHRRSALGPMRVQLVYPVSRYRHIQSLQHLCRFAIVKNMRRDQLHLLPLPIRLLDYVTSPHYYSEQIDQCMAEEENEMIKREQEEFEQQQLEHVEQQQLEHIEQQQLEHIEQQQLEQLEQERLDQLEHQNLGQVEHQSLEQLQDDRQLQQQPSTENEQNRIDGEVNNVRIRQRDSCTTDDHDRSDLGNDAKQCILDIEKNTDDSELCPSNLLDRNKRPSSEALHSCEKLPGIKLESSECNFSNGTGNAVNGMFEFCNRIITPLSKNSPEIFRKSNAFFINPVDCNDTKSSTAEVCAKSSITVMNDSLESELCKGKNIVQDEATDGAIVNVLQCLDKSIDEAVRNAGDKAFRSVECSSTVEANKKTRDVHLAGSTNEQQTTLSSPPPSNCSTRTCVSSSTFLPAIQLRPETTTSIETLIPKGFVSVDKDTTIFNKESSGLHNCFSAKVNSDVKVVSKPPLSLSSYLQSAPSKPVLSAKPDKIVSYQVDFTAHSPTVIKLTKIVDNKLRASNGEIANNVEVDFGSHDEPQSCKSSSRIVSDESCNDVHDSVSNILQASRTKPSIGNRVQSNNYCENKCKVFRETNEVYNSSINHDVNVLDGIISKKKCCINGINDACEKSNEIVTNCKKKDKRNLIPRSEDSNSVTATAQRSFNVNSENGNWFSIVCDHPKNKCLDSENMPNGKEKTKHLGSESKSVMPLEICNATRKSVMPLKILDVTDEVCSVGEHRGSNGDVGNCHSNNVPPSVTNESRGNFDKGILGSCGGYCNSDKVYCDDEVSNTVIGDKVSNDVGDACCGVDGKANDVDACCSVDRKANDVDDACCGVDGKANDVDDACCGVDRKANDVDDACCGVDGKANDVADACCGVDGKANDVDDACCFGVDTETCGNDGGEQETNANLEAHSPKLAQELTLQNAPSLKSVILNASLEELGTF